MKFVCFAGMVSAWAGCMLAWIGGLADKMHVTAQTVTGLIAVGIGVMLVGFFAGMRPNGWVNK